MSPNGCNPCPRSKHKEGSRRATDGTLDTYGSLLPVLTLISPSGPIHMKVRVVPGWHGQTCLPVRSVEDGQTFLVPRSACPCHAQNQLDRTTR